MNNKKQVLAINMERLGENKFSFEVLKVALTMEEEKALKVFIENMILKEQYQESYGLEDLENLRRRINYE